jgi:predicted nucleic acid-binding protein
VSVVVDASIVVAALVDTGPAGTWADAVLAGGALSSPHLMPAEVAAVLRRTASANQISTDLAALAHRDLLDLQVVLFAYEPFGERVWELRDNLTPYDAWYVAVAEAIDAPLATVDHRLSRAAGPRCEFLTPP